MTTLRNFTFDEIQIGQTTTYSKTLSERDLVLFAEVSGDVNPVHLDAEFAAGSMFGERIAHGMWTGALISAALALQLPGPGTIYVGQTLSFRAPVKLGDTATSTQVMFGFTIAAIAAALVHTIMTKQVMVPKCTFCASERDNGNYACVV